MKLMKINHNAETNKKTMLKLITTIQYQPTKKGSPPYDDKLPQHIRRRVGTAHRNLRRKPSMVKIVKPWAMPTLRIYFVMGVAINARSPNHLPFQRLHLLHDAHRIKPLMRELLPQTTAAFLMGRQRRILRR
jgi:hypothetical protein